MEFRKLDERDTGFKETLGQHGKIDDFLCIEKDQIYINPTGFELLRKLDTKGITVHDQIVRITRLANGKYKIMYYKGDFHTIKSKPISLEGIDSEEVELLSGLNERFRVMSEFMIGHSLNSPLKIIRFVDYIRIKFPSRSINTAIQSAVGGQVESITRATSTSPKQYETKFDKQYYAVT